MKTHKIQRTGTIFKRLPTFTFRVFDEAAHAAVYNIAAEQVAKDRLSTVQWYVANGHHYEFDATLVAMPLGCPKSSKPCRQVQLHLPTFEEAVAEVCEKMKECITEADATE